MWELTDGTEGNGFVSRGLRNRLVRDRRKGRNRELSGAGTVRLEYQARRYANGYGRGGGLTVKGKQRT